LSQNRLIMKDVISRRSRKYPTILGYSNSIIILLLLFLGLNPAYGTNYPVRVGDSLVIIQKQQHGKGKAFIHLHQNETTALKAAKTVIKTQGGSVLTLRHSGGRNIIFHYHKRRYEFDPNRIFTDRGIKKTLVKFGNYSLPAHAQVKKLANKIKLLLPKGKIIAVHNNQSYSLKDYFPGRSSAVDARALNFNHRQSYRNFYVVTQKSNYLRLKKLNFNSVWQTPNATNDGSLSVYLASRNYVNVEAGYSQLAAQINMLKHA